jgi:hypothetical protein
LRHRIRPVRRRAVGCDRLRQARRPLRTSESRSACSQWHS